MNISINSAEDIVNPIMLATLGRTHQLPGPEDIKAAMQLLEKLGQTALLGVPPPEQIADEGQPGPGMAPGLPGGPQGPPMGPEGPLPPGQDQAQPLPPGGIETPGIANAGWETAPRIDRRDTDTGAPS